MSYSNGLQDAAATFFWQPTTEWLGSVDDFSDSPPLQQQQHQQSVHYDTVPRSLQQTNSPDDLATRADLEPFDLRYLDDSNARHNIQLPTRQLSTTPAALQLSKSQPPSSLAYHTNKNGKRNLHHVDMAHSASYTYGTSPCQHPHPSTFVHAHVDDVQVYEPAEYCSKLSSVSETENAQAAAKRARVDRFDASQQSFEHSFAPSLCLPSAHDVSPSTSISTHLSPSSHTTSDAMSRQSSVTSASVTDAFDMMRVESSFSTNSHLFPLDDIDASFVSCSTERPAVSSQPTISLHDSSASNLLSNVGHGLVGTDFSLFGQSISDAAVGHQQHAHNLSPLAQAQAMERSTSEQSALSTVSTEIKGSERRRKQIENARQQIAPKKAPGPAATSKSASSADNSVEAQESATKRKEAISKAPYVRPQHPKLKCTICDEFPNGFRGEHELRRHWDRAHAQLRKVWICTEPTTRTEWWPAKPLGICKQCKQQKNYSAYYNAAAHLRRAHFCPRKRGRKARGEERESRAGKAGGDWPPIEWLKANGWLKEIEISAESEHGMEDASPDELHNTFDNGLSQDCAVPNQQQLLATDIMALQTWPPTTDFSMGYPSPIDSTTVWPMAPAMEHATSAPANFAAMTPIYTPEDFMMNQQQCLY
ncbi:hypothetical protein Slin15195_G002930 [Septoria linicola]|uniref:DUF7896 domain-containing protein n=1 Tax=Septoria linicola TaxID=215465 RepID=A0A9Q9AG73_9PEZI|nr:hypothetical protein Slin14017_G002950 [Septoria linicola]USW46974.1 hypothetical protein Slin15195_G002930 [Septoria linicola]